jgi:hypothetical protein
MNRSKGMELRVPFGYGMPLPVVVFYDEAVPAKPNLLQPDQLRRRKKTPEQIAPVFSFGVGGGT